MSEAAQPKPIPLSVLCVGTGSFPVVMADEVRTAGKVLSDHDAEDLRRLPFATRHHHTVLDELLRRSRYHGYHDSCKSEHYPVSKDRSHEFTSVEGDAAWEAFELRVRSRYALRGLHGRLTVAHSGRIAPMGEMRVARRAGSRLAPTTLPARRSTTAA